MKRVVVIILVFAIFAVFYQCMGYEKQQESVPEDVACFYEDFLRTFSEGTYAELAPFYHFENPLLREYAEEDFENILDYEIIKWKKLKDNLWVVSTDIETDDIFGRRVCYQFVGYIDNKLYVMPGGHNIPDEMAEGIDFSKYTPKDALPMDNLATLPKE